MKDKNIAKRIVDSLSGHGDYTTLIEIGPGTGVLSEFLLEEKKYHWYGMDVDKESIQYLKEMYPQYMDDILEQDFLKADIVSLFSNQNIGVIGNFPYNISTQILFKILDHRNQITEMVGMFQKEVAQRVVAGPGGKVNGILSILCQAFYDVEYLFVVDEHVFNPPPKVKSAVIRFKRNTSETLDCDEKKFFSLVKMGYNQRRKTLRNALKSLNIEWSKLANPNLAGQRAEQLSVEEFVAITQSLS